MKHLTIKNLGPIKDVDIELSRFNFFIGPQSSGKSTIAKMISSCNWVEKETLTTLNPNAIKDGEYFINLVEGFHKMEGYFNRNTVVDFETDFLKMQIHDKSFSLNIKDSDEYVRQKICYIPSERNMVTLPELQGFEFGQTNLRSFLFDWFKAREFYAPKNKANVLNLGIKYFYDKNSKQEDQIEDSNGNLYHIALSSASSGLQSVIPLQIMLQYYSGEYFESFENKTSFDYDIKTRNLQELLVDKYLLIPSFPTFKPQDRANLTKEVVDALQKGDETMRQHFINYQKAFFRLKVPQKTTFIIEEPEQNLFPTTQMELLESLVNLCNGKHKHDFTITTHSPYLLNQLNLMFKRYDVNANDGASLNWSDVSTWAVEDGVLTDLKLRNAHLVNPEYLSSPLDQIYQLYEKYETTPRN